MVGTESFVMIRPLVWQILRTKLTNYELSSAKASGFRLWRCLCEIRFETPVHVLESISGITQCMLFLTLDFPL